MRKAKVLSRQQRAANTRKANRQSKAPVAITNDSLQQFYINQLKNTEAIDNIGSTMTLLEQAVDSLIQRINAQTQRIKDMM